MEDQTQQQAAAPIKVSPPSEITYESSVFSLAGFEHAQRIAIMLAKASVIPDSYKNNVANTMVALEFAQRLNVSPLMVMQNLYIVHGNPAFNSKYCIAQLNNKYHRYGGVQFNMTGEKGTMTRGCYVTVEDANGNVIKEGTEVNMAMAKAEGWIDKKGSKWVTMPEKMLKYRAASFFANEINPEILMGLKTDDEVLDIEEAVVVQPVDKEAERVQKILSTANTLDELNALKPRIKQEQMGLFQNRMTELNLDSNG